MNPEPESGLGDTVRGCAVVRRDVHERYTASCLLVLPPVGNAVELNGPAALVWELLHGGTQVEDIAQIVAETYRQDPARVAPLVHDTLEQLRATGLTTNA